MKQKRAALYCRAGKGNTGELFRQHDMLRRYAVLKGLNVVESFLDESTGELSMQNPVQFQVLCAAKQSLFDLLLVEKLEMFPYDTEDIIPPISLYSVKENTTIRIGCSNNEIFETVLAPPGYAVVYFDKYFKKIEK